MKNLISVIAVLLLTSFIPAEQKKLYIIKADLQTWDAVLKVIDLSKAEPEQRIAVREFIIAQINDTTINKR